MEQPSSTPDLSDDDEGDDERDEPLRVAAYVRVSTDEQDAERQRESIRREYEGDAYRVEWYADLGLSGADASRPEYQRLQDDVEAGEVDIVAAHELDRLGRSFSELAAFVEMLDAEEVALDLTNQPVNTRGDDWMSDLTLNLLIVFADAERRMIQDRVTQGVRRAQRQGKHTGRPPYGYEVEDGFLVEIPHEHTRAQQFVREVRRGREKRATARFFGIPEGSIESILSRSEENYDVEFDNDAWKVERAKVEAGEKSLPDLGESSTYTGGEESALRD